MKRWSLNSYSGYAQNLQENVHTEKREHYASHIQANVNRMDKIIHQMLELTRLESDYLKIKLEEVALDHTPNGGRIRIRILEDRLEVYNSGSHIPEDKIEELWLPFKKGDAARSYSKGIGLGLAITRTILELHKFPFGAKNKDDGVVFWFRFR